jgi:hypothetical protein
MAASRNAKTSTEVGATPRATPHREADDRAKDQITGPNRDDDPLIVDRENDDNPPHEQSQCTADRDRATAFIARTIAG